jgi:hypothetical protein
VSTKPIEIGGEPLMCGTCMKPIEPESSFIPVMAWRDEPVDTRVSTIAFGVRIARMAHVVAGIHVGCLFEVVPAPPQPR